MNIFITERLIVRQYEFEKDTDNFFLLNGDEEVVRYIRAPKPKEECDRFLKEVIQAYDTDRGRGRWAAELKSTGGFAGSFAFIPVEGTEDYQLGYALLKQYWGMGYATELMKEGIQYVFNTTCLNEIYGITEAANIASQKVLLKTGFTLKDKYIEGEKEMCKFILKRKQNPDKPE